MGTIFETKVSFPEEARDVYGHINNSFFPSGITSSELEAQEQFPTIFNGFFTLFARYKYSKEVFPGEKLIVTIEQGDIPYKVLGEKGEIRFTAVKKRLEPQAGNGKYWGRRDAEFPFIFEEGRVGIMDDCSIPNGTLKEQGLGLLIHTVDYSTKYISLVKGPFSLTSSFAYNGWAPVIDLSQRLSTKGQDVAEANSKQVLVQFQEGGSPEVLRPQSEQFQRILESLVGKTSLINLTLEQLNKIRGKALSSLDSLV